MIPDDPLAAFYASTPRRSGELTGRSAAYGDVDSALNELEVPAVLDDDGDWTLETDVGQIALIVDDVTGDLVAIQSLMEADDSPDFMHALLRLNFEARGLASFGAITQGSKNVFVIAARVSGDEISRESVQRVLVDTMRLSRRLDELLGTAAGAEPAAEPEPIDEPPPPEGAPVAAPAAETVFSQPVPEGPPPDAEPAPPPEPAAPEPEPAPPAPEPAPADPPPDYPPPVVTPEYPPPEYPPPQPDLPAANWYPDPYAQARLRYWDGQQWTEHVSN